MKFIIPLLFLFLYACGNSEPAQKYSYFRNYSRNFNDLNPKHLDIAKRQGVSPVSSAQEAALVLREINSCSKYEIDKLTHSIPYLTKDSEKVLAQIGNNFQDSLAAKGLTKYKVIVTSVLRTQESVAKLRNKNINASNNSAHLYGTTFDIAYTRFIKTGWGDDVKPELLKSMLADVLFDLRKKGGCFVKYEYKQGCFHITAREVVR
ncbi:MAG: DUF5715 family protein [Marinifilaceae bacterium]